MYKGIADKREEGKGKRERQMNAEFQRVSRRDKKAFLSEPCREIEENNRMGKTIEIFSKNSRHLGNISSNMGTVKDKIART